MSKGTGNGNGAAKKPRKKSPGPTGPTLVGGSKEARRLTAVILEVLAGQRTPADAAALVGVSVPRYYQIELRALQGLLKACEPRGPGRKMTPEREVAKLRAEIEKLERTNSRNQALLRMSQRAIGVSAAKTKSNGKTKGKRTRRPVARGLKAAAKLMRDASSLPAEQSDAKNR